jgi:hypothetical protein
MEFPADDRNKAAKSVKGAFLPENRNISTVFWPWPSKLSRPLMRITMVQCWDISHRDLRVTGKPRKELSMKGISGLFPAMLFFALLTAPAVAEVDEAKKNAITQTALDYMDGAHASDAARMERAIHPELTKVTVVRMPTSRDIIRKTGYTRLIEAVRAEAAPLPEDERDIKLEIYAVREGIAAVKVTSSMFYDYLLLAEIDGQWKIINVLWKMSPEWMEKKRAESAEVTPPFDAEAEKDGIEAAALDYLEGYYTGDADRMARGVHPELTKVWPKVVPQTGRPYLEKIGASYLIEATRTGSGKLDEDRRKIEMTILDTGENIALVEALSAMFYDYLQLAKVDGEWKIINVLWVMNPDAMK